MRDEPIDDSALFHRSDYDPVKAREYYLKTRQLKGRRRGAQVRPQGPGRINAVAPTRKPKKAMVDSQARRAELEAQRARLEKRLDRLKEVLRKLVDAAQKRAGVDESEDTPKDKADRNEQRKRDKPLTAAEKRKKAKADKERREKEGKTSVSAEVAQLQKQIADYKKRIAEALEDARKSNAQNKPKTASKGR